MPLLALLQLGAPRLRRIPLAGAEPLRLHGYQPAGCRSCGCKYACAIARAARPAVALPPRYRRDARPLTALGIPTFIAMVVVYYW